MSTIVNISMRCVQQIIRLNYLAHKIVEDIVNGRQTSGMKLVNLREMLRYGVSNWINLRASVFNYADLLQQILTERKTS